MAGAAVNIRVGTRDNRPIDIIITGQQGAFDINTVEASIKNALQAQGVDLSRVVIDAGEMTQVSSAGSGAREILDTWTVFPAGAPKGEMLGDDMMRGPNLQGPSGQYHPTLDTDADVDIEFQYSTTCMTYSPAVLFRWSKNPNGTYTGYYAGVTGFYGFIQNGHNYDHYEGGALTGMYIFKSSSSGGTTVFPSTNVRAGYETWMHSSTAPWYTGRAEGLMALKNTMVYADGGLWTPQNVWVLGCQARNLLNRANRFNYHVTMKGNVISFDLSVTRMKNGTGAWETSPVHNLTWVDPNPIKSGSIGFFANISNAIGISAAKFETTSINDLIEVIRSPRWRPNSHRFIIDATELVRQDFSDNIMVGELMERMSADQAHYIGWGNTVTQASVQSFVQRNDDRGIYIPLTTPFVETARYIEPIVNNNPAGSEDIYVLQGNQYEFTTNVS